MISSDENDCLTIHYLLRGMGSSVYYIFNNSPSNIRNDFIERAHLVISFFVTFITLASAQVKYIRVQIN
jgi:hypothetical protein